MKAVEVLMIVSILLQVGAMLIAIFLVNKTRYMALWICCLISLALLCLERYLQLREFAGGSVSDEVFAWVGIVVSLSFSICVVCARLLVDHVDYVSRQRRILEHRLLTAVLRTEERQRASFSRELHDGLGPLLSSAKMSLSTLQRANLGDKERGMLESSQAVIDEAIRSLREISNNLSPHVLNSFGLSRGLRNFVDRLQQVQDAPINLTTTLGDKRYDANVEVVIYRVVCELINNSLKHAACSKIEVRLMEESGLLVVEYSDNGRGFVVGDVEDKGMGLANIRSRVSSLRGKFVLKSQPGEGMSVRVAVAVDGKAITPDTSLLEPPVKPKTRRKNGKKRN